MIWSYGVTTTSSRLGDTVQCTVDSLEAAGFECPRLFIDGWNSPSDVANQGLPVTARDRPVGVVANWITALWELYAREPDADRYAIFQDDVRAVTNLKAYLERTPWPENGYLNLYTHRENQARAKGRIGWFTANQKGLGALGLVFTVDGVIELLRSNHMAHKPSGVGNDFRRRNRCIDGGVLESLREAGYKEYCHNPSLLQHVGCKSTIGNHYRGVKSFPGEEFDAMSLLQGMSNV